MPRLRLLLPRPRRRLTSPLQPAAVVDANTPVADQLREMANGKFDRVLGGTKERAGFEAFYSGRNFAPLWITDGKVNERAKAAIAYLGKVDADGLDPADYPVPDFTSLTDPAALGRRRDQAYSVGRDLRAPCGQWDAFIGHGSAATSSTN